MYPMQIAVCWNTLIHFYLFECLLNILVLLGYIFQESKAIFYQRHELVLPYRSGSLGFQVKELLKGDFSAIIDDKCCLNIKL